MARCFEWHLQTRQSVVLELVQYYWWEQGCSVEVLDGPQDVQAWIQFHNRAANEPEDAQLIAQVLVSATDGAGWTVVWPVYSPWNDELWLHLSWEAQAPILVGEYHSVVEQSHWAWFEHGRLQAEHYDFPTGKTSSFHLEPTRRPAGDLSLKDAFAAFDRTFPALLWLQGCKQILVRGDAAWYYQPRQHWTRQR